jgi:DNA mismatch repair protein MutS
MSLIRDYLDKTKLYIHEYGELTILFMQNGAFFEIYSLKDEYGCCIGSNIVDFSRICDLNIVDKKAAGDKHVTIDNYNVVNAGFKTHFIEKYIKKMQDNGYTIVVFEEDSVIDPISKKIVRNLTGIYSPGTFFSSDNEHISNNTCCIWIEIKKPTLKSQNKHVYVGVSQIDIYTGTTSIMEYTIQYIKNPTTFDELERFISIYNPSETILISNLPLSDLEDIVSYTNIKSKSIHNINITAEESPMNSKNIQRALNCEKQTYQLQLLRNFYKITDITSFMSMFNDNVYATQSFCYLLDFIYQHNPNLINKISIPTLENTSNKLILANHSLKQLNIIDDDNYKGKYSSVVKMLNECITSMGKRQFTYNFLNPITDAKLLQMEYDIVENVLLHLEEYNSIKPLLTNIKDISKINRQIVLQKITPKCIYQLYISICSAKQLYEFAISHPYLNTYLHFKISNFNNLLHDIDSIIKYLSVVFVIDECKEIDNIQKIENCFIQPGVDAYLDNKMQTLLESQDQLDACRTYFSSIISTYETNTKTTKKTKKIDNIKTTNKFEEYMYNETKDSNNDETNKPQIIEDDEDIKSYVKIHITEKNNFSLIATDRRCKIIEEVLSKNKIKSVVLKYNSSYYNTEKQMILELGNDSVEYIRQSASSKTISNNQISQLCKNVGSIKTTLINTISKVYLQIIKELSEYQTKIDNICELVTFLDLIYTKAHIVEKYNYCKPEIDQTTTNTKSFIQATDLRHCLIEKIQQTEIYVANDITIGNGCLDGILLYGTNAVGKTSFIRALGISVIMAQAGLYVPASSYKFKPYKYIFTRILGNDNIFKGLSTFAVEMSELRTILRLADNNSLVLGDELCSGTESISGVSIFVAGVQALHKKECSFIFATHIHEIIGYDEITSLHTVSMKHMSVIYDKEKDCLVYNRKLQDGPGNNMYGLEVCKSLSLPTDFLENAHNIRMKYHPESASILEHKQSHFNAKHITGGYCENCGIRQSAEVHHLQYQLEANDNGIIKKNGLVFNKNHAANLVNLCTKCHDALHKTGVKYKKTKTNKGIILEEIPK